MKHLNRKWNDLALVLCGLALCCLVIVFLQFRYNYDLLGTTSTYLNPAITKALVFARIDTPKLSDKEAMALAKARIIAKTETIDGDYQGDSVWAGKAVISGDAGGALVYWKMNEVLNELYFTFNDVPFSTMRVAEQNRIEQNNHGRELATYQFRSSQYGLSFSWAPVPGATGYIVTVSIDEGFNSLVAGTPVEVTGTNYYTNKVIARVYYYWKATAIIP